MSQIKCKDSKPEMLVRKFLFSQGFRYKIHDQKLPGKPDLVLPKYRTVIFVHGCFWHGHEDCRYFVVPKTRTEWWMAKIADTKIRDLRNQFELTTQGFTVILIYECELKPDQRAETLSSLSRKLSNA